MRVWILYLPGRYEIEIKNGGVKSHLSTDYTDLHRLLVLIINELQISKSIICVNLCNLWTFKTATFFYITYSNDLIKSMKLSKTVSNPLEKYVSASISVLSPNLSTKISFQ